MTLSSDRYVLPLKANFKGRMQGIIHDWSQTGETCYFEPMFLVEINNRLQELKREEREEEHKVLAAQAKNTDNDEAVKEAERRHLLAERRLIEVNAELESLRKDGGDRERLERKCLLLENDLKAANQELMTLERGQSRLETEKQQLAEELEKVKAGGAAGGGAVVDEAEIRQWKLRADDLRESLRKQRTENERLQERVDVLIKAKELEEKQRKEVESRLRTALRIQARQQGGF